MADIQYVIGARDAATPALNKVDSSMSRLEKSTKQLGESSERSLKRMSIGVDTLLKSTVVLYAAKKAVDTLVAAFGFIAGGVTDFNNAEASAAKLAQAMQANGEASQQSIDANVALTDSMEKRLNVEAETIQALMSEAANLGVANDKLDETAAAAIGLSEAMGVSLETGLKNARLAAEGNFKAFEKNIPAIKNMSTAEEKLAAVLELSNKGLEQKETRAQSAAGASERLSIKLGNLAETIGGYLSPILDAAWNGISRIADVLISILSPALDKSGGTLKTWSDTIVKGIEWVTNNAIAGITFLEVVFSNFGKVIGIAFDWIKLKYETYKEDTKHLFTVEIPAYVKWFGDNFFNILQTTFSAVSTVVTNGIQNVGDSFSALWDFIASGGQTDLLGQLGEIVGRSYLEGFENSIGELPTVAGRAMTDTEKSLKKSIDESTTDLAQQFAEKLAGRKVNFGKGNPFGVGIDGEGNKIGGIGNALGVNGAKSIATGDSIQAQESRLLTRGTGLTASDLLKQIAEGISNLNNQAQKQTASNEEIESAARELLYDQQQNPKLNLIGVPE